MNRRAFGTGLGAVLAAPLVAEAQPVGKVYRVGVAFNAMPASEIVGSDYPGTRAFVHRLRALGYVEGQNLILEPRSGEGHPERFGAIVRELVGLNCDVIVTSGTEMARQAKAVTTTVPIVMATSIDPVGTGLVRSLARPGGNITGLNSGVSFEVEAKRLELLKEAVPRAVRIMFLSSRLGIALVGKRMQAAAQVLGLTLVLAEHAPNDYTNAFATISRERPDALFVSSDAQDYVHRRLIADFALRNRLPSTWPFQEAVESGGLMSYGISVPDVWRRTAEYVDKILKGAKPADLPVEQPTKFELAISLKTAKALGIDIPPAILARADRVIE